METYNPERYWSRVAKEIPSRSDGFYLAGNNTPFYRYKRGLFLDKFLKTIPFKGKVVLEVGCGPGGNLLEASLLHPQTLVGCDISEEMLKLAKMNLKQYPRVSLHRVNGKVLPFKDVSFDIVFTTTVLQHNIDEEVFKMIIREIFRVSNSMVFLIEETAPRERGSVSCLLRPVECYARIGESYGYKLKEVNYLPIHMSFLVCRLIQKMFDSSSRKEGEPATALTVKLQNLSLPFTALLDKHLNFKKGLTKMSFEKIN